MSAPEPKGMPVYFTMTADRNIPELNLLAGDVVKFTPENERPFSAHRYFSPTLATLAALVAVGGLRVVHGTRGDLLQRLMQLEATRAAAQYSRPQCQVEVDRAPIDIEAALKELESPTALAPKEGYAPQLLESMHGREAWDRFWQRREQYERRRPRACKTCGETFVAGTTASAANCQACKAANRKRCYRCGEVFTTESNKERRCVPCLKEAAQGGDVAAAEQLRRKRQT